MSRYEKGHKADTHRRVVEIAARRFRAEGIDAVGVASLMADAGLTHGGFYAHFESKEALVKEAVIAALQSSAAAQPDDGAATAFDLRAYIEDYLSPAHRDRPATGCALASLAPEVARRPRPTRNAFGKESKRLIGNIAAALPKRGAPDQAVEAAYGLFAQMMGALQLSRVVPDKALSDRLLEIGRADALRRAGLDELKPAVGAGARARRR